MPDNIDRDRLKDKRNTIHSERYYAETEVLQGQIVKHGSEESFAVPATLNSDILGIAMNTVTTENIAEHNAGGNIALIELEVIMLGVYVCLGGTIVDFGEFVVSDAAGRAIPADSVNDSPRHILGKAMRHCDTDGDQMHVFLNIYDEWDASRGKT